MNKENSVSDDKEPVRENMREDNKIKDDKKKKHYSTWESIKKDFPWRSFILGLLIPKMIFYICWHYQMIKIGAIVSLLWCVTYFVIDYLKIRKIEWFALLGMAMILIRITSILARHSPALYLIVEAIDNALIGIIFLGSLLFPRPLIQVFVDKADVKIPDVLRKSPYYRKAWMIVTAAWGLANVVLAVILLCLRMKNPEAAKAFDAFSGWPTTILLMVFTFKFPRWYFARNWSKIQPATEVKSNGNNAK